MARLRSALLQGMAMVVIASPLYPETPPAKTQAMPSVDQIVARMRQHEAYQSKQLSHYQAVRHYQVQYRGYGTSIAAQMDVEISYDTASGKSFRILSHHGSKLLFEKVLERAVQSEKEASRDPQSMALTPANYRFRLIGTDRVDGRPAWILHVDPVRAGKFLYRGRVWVDAADYAVDKIEVEPAKNPSFWISSTEIVNTYQDLQGTWLPQENRSESKIRIGGTAVLTIDYGTYHLAVRATPNQANPSPGKLTGAASSR